jgi:hypothetical protein
VQHRGPDRSSGFGRKDQRGDQNLCGGLGAGSPVAGDSEPTWSERRIAKRRITVHDPIDHTSMSFCGLADTGLVGGENASVVRQCVSVTTESEGADAGPTPTRLRATTVHVYVLPPVRPRARTCNLCEAPVPLLPPSLETHFAR